MGNPVNTDLVVGTLEVNLKVVKGHIQKCRIYGDFFEKKNVADIENLLVGCILREDAVASALKDIDMKPYFGPNNSTILTNLVLV